MGPAKEYELYIVASHTCTVSLVSANQISNMIIKGCRIICGLFF